MGLRCTHDLEKFVLRRTAQEGVLFTDRCPLTRKLRAPGTLRYGRGGYTLKIGESYTVGCREGISTFSIATVQLSSHRFRLACVNGQRGRWYGFFGGVFKRSVILGLLTTMSMRFALAAMVASPSHSPVPLHACDAVNVTCCGLAAYTTGSPSVVRSQVILVASAMASYDDVVEEVHPMPPTGLCPR